MGRIEKLLEYMKAADKDSFLQHALALEYIKIGKDEEARNLFNEILLREPTYVGSYYHLGKLLERAGDFDKAIRCLFDFSFANGHEWKLADFYFIPGFNGFRFRQTHTRNLRLAIGASGHLAVVDRYGMMIRNSLDCHDTFLHGDMGEQG